VVVRERLMNSSAGFVDIALHVHLDGLLG